MRGWWWSMLGASLPSILRTRRRDGILDGRRIPRPSVHFVAHVSSLCGIVKLDSDYSGAGLIIFGIFTSFVEACFRPKRSASSWCVHSIFMKTITLNSSHAVVSVNEFCGRFLRRRFRLMHIPLPLWTTLYDAPLTIMWKLNQRTHHIYIYHMSNLDLTPSSTD